MNMMSYADAFSLRGHRALVTGGGSGLGLAIAQCFVAAGAEVVIAGRGKEALDTACATLGERARGVVFDVTRTEAAEEFAGQIESQIGPVSILVNNAGHTVKKPVAEMTIDDFRGVLDVHVTGAFALARAFLPQLARTGRGSILFTASVSSFIGLPLVIGYATAKSAYLGLVHALASELGSQGIRVNGVAPGWFDTALFRKATAADPARREKILGRTPLKRLGNPEEVGWAMTYLAADAAAFVTGHVLVVDGGALIGF
jgi:gluconate 5-dehydrogenase